MKLDYKVAYVYDIERIVEEFYKLLDSVNCRAGMTIPDTVLVRAVMNQVMGYSPHRGTASIQVMLELQRFGLPTLVAEELFKQLCGVVAERLCGLLGRPPFRTDHKWQSVDSTSILIMEI